MGDGIADIAQRPVLHGHEKAQSAVANHTYCCTAVYWMDERMTTAQRLRMTPRRSRYAPADESCIPHWLVTYDVYRTVLAIGVDLRAELRHAIEQCEANGWTVENDDAYGFFFRDRGGDRCQRVANNYAGYRFDGYELQNRRCGASLIFDSESRSGRL
jgi:hypothetical protein